MRWRLKSEVAGTIALHTSTLCEESSDTAIFACCLGALVGFVVILLDRLLQDKFRKAEDSNESTFEQSPRAAQQAIQARSSRNVSRQSSRRPSVQDLFIGPATRPLSRTTTTGDVTPPQVRDREDVLDELLKCSCMDQIWILKGLAEVHGEDVLEQALASLSGNVVTSKSTTRSSASARAKVKGAENMKIDETPQLRFSSFQYYAEEGEVLTVRILRIGDLSKPTYIGYHTKDVTAQADENYTPLSGTMEFAPGDYEKELAIQIHENDFYGPSLEFLVALDEWGLENGHIDKDMWQARIEIMDNDAFPTNLYKELIDPELLVKDDAVMQTLDKTRLLFEYFRFCMDDRKVFWGMVKMMAIGQCENLYGFINLVMSVYLVDFVVVTAVPESKLISRSREADLALVTMCLIVPLFGLHLLNYLRNFWGVSGRARTIIQTALLRKFLDYSEDVRAKIHHGDIILATTQDSYVLVDKGLMKLLVFCKQLGAVFMLMAFQFAAPWIFNRPFRIWLLGLLFLVPAMMSLISRLRFKPSSESQDAQFQSEAKLTELVHETVVCYPLIADYSRRPVFVEKFGKAIAENNDGCTTVAAVLTNNSFLAVWVTTIFVAGFTIVGGMLVIQGTMTLGIFLANIRIFREVGDTCENVYSVWLEMQQVLPPLFRVTRLLNLPIDIDERKALSEERERQSRQKAELLDLADKRQLTDSMPIIIRDINVSFHTSTKPISLTGRVEIVPGTLVAVVGPRNAGKATLLKVMGGAILPQPEDLFIPSHMTVLHVDPDPIFFSGTLMDNLLFGCKDVHHKNAKRRVLRICQRLGLSEGVLHLIDSKRTLPWSSVLSFSQKALISLARALVANPHVLLVHRPVDFLEEDAQRAVISTLREFVEKRGLEQEDPFKYRAPHTCVVTTASSNCLQMADKVVCVSQTHGLKIVSQEEAASLMR